MKGVKYSENRRLGHISRSKRCLSTCSNISYTLEISPILHSKPVLSIQSPLFRINFSTKSLHKNSICSGSIPEDSRHKTSCISRRLADCKSEQKAVIVRSRELSQSPEIFRFSVKQRKIDTYPNPNTSLLGGIVSSRQGLNLSHSRENLVKLNLAIENLLTQEKASALMFLHLLGIMASCIQMIPIARLFMRPVQLHLLSFWRPKFAQHHCTNSSYSTSEIPSHLWSSSANTLKGQSFQFPKTSVVITTDASKKGFGGFMNEQIFQ